MQGRFQPVGDKSPFWTLLIGIAAESVTIVISQWQRNHTPNRAPAGTFDAEPGLEPAVERAESRFSPPDDQLPGDGDDGFLPGRAGRLRPLG
jgi:hypothetical protein